MAPSGSEPGQSVLATRQDQQRFRMAAPNSRPRDAVLVGLDPAACDLAVRLAAERPERRRAFDLSHEQMRSVLDVQFWLTAAAARTSALSEAVGEANLVVVIASAGTNAQGLPIVADICRARGKWITAVVVGARTQDETSIASTLAQLRPSAAMVVVADRDFYLSDMLLALQA